MQSRYNEGVKRARACFKLSGPRAAISIARGGMSYALSMRSVRAYDRGFADETIKLIGELN